MAAGGDETMRRRPIIAGILVLGACAMIHSSAHAREVVALSGYSRDPIVIKASERHLYFVLGDGHAVRYPVGVGRSGRHWSGASLIDGKYLKPAWAPPAAIRREKPYLPSVIPC